MQTWRGSPNLCLLKVLGEIWMDCASCLDINRYVCISKYIHIYIYDPGLRFPNPPPPPPMWWPCPHYPLLQWLYGGRLVALKVSWQKQNIELQAGTFGVWNTFSCRNKKPTPSNLMGSMMIIRVLPIHVPRMLWGGDTLSLLHWNHMYLWWSFGLTHPCSTNTFSCHNKKPTPSNLIGTMMIIRVLPIHVPPCYEGGCLKPTPLKPYMTYDDHLVWPIHVPRIPFPVITKSLLHLTW